MNHPIVALVICLAIFVYVWLGINVARARGKYGVKAPAISGNADFERVFRAQQNMLEQLVIFIPALLVFAQYLSPLWGAAIGAVWIVGRIWYALGYYAPQGRRGPGFVLSFGATMVLLIGALTGIARAMLA